MIKKADYVVVAADINVELNRFVNKKIYITNTNEAINTPIQTLEKTIKSSKIYEEESFSNANSFGDMGGTKKGFMKHFLNGVSHMIPFIVFSGIMYAIVHLVTIAVHGDN
jgi:PTS system fructose-specific IIC component